MGLAGMAKAFNELIANGGANNSPMPNGSGYCWSENGVRATIASLPPVCDLPNCAIMLCLRMSITAVNAVSIARCS